MATCFCPVHGATVMLCKIFASVFVFSLPWWLFGSNLLFSCLLTAVVFYWLSQSCDLDFNQEVISVVTLHVVSLQLQPPFSSFPVCALESIVCKLYLHQQLIIIVSKCHVMYCVNFTFKYLVNLHMNTANVKLAMLSYGVFYCNNYLIAFLLQVCQYSFVCVLGW